jgi:hypothetical protein
MHFIYWAKRPYEEAIGVGSDGGRVTQHHKKYHHEKVRDNSSDRYL